MRKLLPISLVDWYALTTLFAWHKWYQPQVLIGGYFLKKKECFFVRFCISIGIKPHKIFPTFASEEKTTRCGNIFFLTPFRRYISLYWGKAPHLVPSQFSSLGGILIKSPSLSNKSNPWAWFLPIFLFSSIPIASCSSISSNPLTESPLNQHYEAAEP